MTRMAIDSPTNLSFSFQAHSVEESLPFVGMANACGSPLWAIETETDAKRDEPRSLWDRVESNLRPQEVFTIRRVIGETVLDRNEGLWREIDALEDILSEAQHQNKDLSEKLAARPAMLPGLETTLLETHLRLLLEKLGVEPDGGAVKGETATAAVGGRGSSEWLATTGRPRPHTFREDELGRKFDRSCCAQAKGICRADVPPHRKHRCSSGSSNPSSRSIGGSSSAPATPPPPLVPLETLQDRAVYEFISAGSSARYLDVLDTDGCGVGGMTGRGLASSHSRGCGEGGPEAAPAGAFSVEDSFGPNSRTGKRPGTSRSARSAPEYLGPGRRLSVATIDKALGKLRTAFEDEAQNLLEEVTDLTHLLEDEAIQKSDYERRSRRKNCFGTADSSSEPTDSGGRPGPVPCSELRRYGKKLEEAVRSKEHAAGVAECLDVRRSRQRTKATKSAVGGVAKNNGRSQEGVVRSIDDVDIDDGEADGVDAGPRVLFLSHGGLRRPGPLGPGFPGPTRLESLKGNNRGVDKKGNKKDAINNNHVLVMKEDHDAKKVEEEACLVGQDRGRVLPLKLRGVVCASRREVEQDLGDDDERFLS